MIDEQTSGVETNSPESVTPSDAVPPEPVQSEQIKPELVPDVVAPPVVTAEPEPVPTTSVPTPAPAPSSPKSFLARALEKIQFRKRAKLAKIVVFAQSKKSFGSTQDKSITNDQVEKLLHVSDATAGRYLRELVAQGKLRKTGTTSGTRYEPTS